METSRPGEQGSAGMGEVHSHISQPDKGLGMSGGHHATAAPGEPSDGSMVGQARERAGEMVDQARDQAEDLMDDARDRIGAARHRVEDAAEQARARASRVIDRAERELDERTGAIRVIRQNPLPALGVAFAVGYLVAGSRQGQRGRFAAMASSQLRGAIMGGVTAALTRELRSIVQEQGGSLASMFGQEERETGASRGTTDSSRSGFEF